MDRQKYRSEVLPSLLLKLDKTYIIDTWKKTFDSESRKHLDKTIRYEANIEFFVENLKEMLSRLEDEIDILSYILWGTVTYHSFGDCNHRTSWSLFGVFCEIFELKPLLSSFETDEAIKFVRGIDDMPNTDGVKTILKSKMAKLGL